MTRPRDGRWRSRPGLAACARLAVLVAPVGGAAGTAVAVARALPPGPGAGAVALRWAAALTAGGVAFLALDRVARRLLPLAVLLRLSLPFPGRAPSRLRVAWAAANLRELEERLRIARTTGFVGEPHRAAETILSLVAAVEAHDRATRGHAERVRLYADLIAAQLRLPEEDRGRLRWAALLHDVGKLEVPRSVLNKPGPLSEGELEVVRRHPDEGARLTRPLHAWLGEWAAAIEEHHERWDGRGYPRGLAGADISLGARIVAVADVYETMTASRPYHRPKTAARAREELLRCAGTQFDPAVVRAFLAIPARRLRVAGSPLARLVRTPAPGRA
jgi:putative nucleotidyltransferase with HDIG domain